MYITWHGERRPMTRREWRRRNGEDIRRPPVVESLMPNPMKVTVTVNGITRKRTLNPPIDPELILATAAELASFAYQEHEVTRYVQMDADLHAANHEAWPKAHNG